MSLAAVFQIGSLGDSIVSVPVLRSLRERLPGCSEYLLVSRFDSEMKVTPQHVFDMSWKSKHQIAYEGSRKGLGKFLSVSSLLAKLRYYRPANCVYLMPSARSQSQVDRDRSFFQAGGVKDLIGFRTLTSEELSCKEAPSVRHTEAYLRFRRVWGEETDTVFPRFAKTPILDPGNEASVSVREWLRNNRRYPDRRLIAVCPFANVEARTLSSDMVSDLVARLEGLENVEVVIVGGAKDHAKAAELIARAGAGINSSGQFLPHESAALLKECSLVLSAESGPLHLAGALGISSVAIFSRVNKEIRRWFPFGQNHTIIYRDVACAGCRLTACPLPDHPCIDTITLEEIYSVAKQKLKGLAAQPAALNGSCFIRWQEQGV